MDTDGYDGWLEPPNGDNSDNAGDEGSGEREGRDSEGNENLADRLNEAFDDPDSQTDVRFEVRGLGNSFFVSINRTPKGEPDWYTAEDGSTIFDWREKFKRQKQNKCPAFEFGEKLVVSGFVGKDNGGYRIHCDADGRLADNFYIATVPKPDPLKEHVGMPLEVIVEIIGERESDWRISNIYNYDAKFSGIFNIPLVNPSQEELEKVPAYKRVVIKGKFLGFGESEQAKYLQGLGFSKGSRVTGYSGDGNKATISVDLPGGRTVRREVEGFPSDIYVEKTYGIIEAENGRKIFLDMSLGKVNFTGGELECLTCGSSNARSYKFPEEGDYVRIGAFVNKDGFLVAHPSDPCWLDKPSENRLQEYNELRENVKAREGDLETAISEKRYAEARKIIGDTRALELTRAELDDFRRLREKIPKSEKQLQTPVGDYNEEGRRHSYIKRIDESYETRVESMTEAEFVDFAREVVTGEKKPIKEVSDGSYCFSIAKDLGISNDKIESLAVKCIDTRLGRIRGKPYDHDRDWDDKYGVDQALKYLSGLRTKSSGEKLFTYIKSFVEEGDFHEVNWRENDDERPRFLFDAVNALETALSFDRFDLGVAERELPYMRELDSYLAVNAEEPITRGCLEKAIKYAGKKLGED